MQKSLDVSVAGIPFTFSTNSIGLFNYLKENYFINKNIAGHPNTISIQKNKNGFNIKNENNHKQLTVEAPVFQSLKGISYIIRAFIASNQYDCCSEQLLFLHGSAFYKNGTAFVFLGPSGQGKTTIIKEIDKNKRLADDTVIIKKERDDFFVYPSPFEKKMINWSDKKFPLCSIYVIEQAARTRIAKIDAKSKISAIFNNTIDLFSAPDFHQPKVLYRLKLELISDVIIKKLFFTKKIDFIHRI